MIKCSYSKTNFKSDVFILSLVSYIIVYQRARLSLASSQQFHITRYCSIKISPCIYVVTWKIITGIEAIQGVLWYNLFTIKL